MQPTHKFAFALSFAGEDRAIVEEVATILKANGATVFYDKDYQAELLGKDLAEYFSQLYQNDALYCVLFLSKSYIGKSWCDWERRSALARAFRSKKDYIIPYFLETVDLPSIPETIGRAELKTTTPTEFASLLLRKLYLERSSVEVSTGVYIVSLQDDEPSLYTEEWVTPDHAEPDYHLSVNAKALASNLTTSDQLLKGLVVYKDQFEAPIRSLENPHLNEVLLRPQTTRFISLALGHVVFSGDRLFAQGPDPFRAAILEDPRFPRAISDWSTWFSKEQFSMFDGVTYELRIPRCPLRVLLNVWNSRIRLKAER